MQEYSAPGEITPPQDANLVQPLIEMARQAPNKPLLAYREGERFIDVSRKDVVDRVNALARGLIGIGVQPGDRVVIMSPTRIEWTYLDYAIMFAGAVTVPIYDTSSAEQIEWIFSDSGAVAGFFETDDLKAEFDKVSDKLDACKNTFVIDDGGLTKLEAAGAEVDISEVEARSAALGVDDMATLIYTSGTTGRPKGCVLTHGNLRWTSVNTITGIEEMLSDDDKQLLFLPLAHIFAKILMLASIERGVQVGFATSPQHLVEELPLFKPTFIAAVPRIFEKVYNGARQKAAADGKGSIFDKAAEVAIAHSKAQQSGKSAGLGVKVKHFLFDKVVYTKLRALFGGELTAANSGGGPLSDRLAHFFNGIGLPIYEGYGLTETSPVLTANTPDHWKIGTVGKPIPGTTIRIADDGEILAKGGQIFQGYYNNQTATDEAIDSDGWFHTGDIGELDADGFLKITGRKKELIVTAGGKNVAPAVLEDRLNANPLISASLVVGDNRPFIAALITIDEEHFPSWAAENGKEGHKVADLTEDPVLVAEVQRAVDHANAAVSKAESIRKFEILPEDFTIEGGELTPTLKLKRKVVSERYSDAIEQLYGE